MVYRRWMSVCSPVQTISNDRHDHHHCHIEFAPVMVVTVVMVTAYCYGRGMHTCPGKTGPSWPKANTGARARRFDSVRVQTEVCRVCGLHLPAVTRSKGEQGNPENNGAMAAAVTLFPVRREDHC